MDQLVEDLKSVTKRVENLEDSMRSVNDELKGVAVANATRDSILTAMQNTLNSIQSSTQLTNERLLAMLDKNLDKRDVAIIDDKKFLQRLLLGCFTVLVTILLGAYGISKLVTLPL